MGSKKKTNATDKAVEAVLAAVFRPKTQPQPSFVCRKCRQTIDVSYAMEPCYTGGVGYALDDKGRKICYKCLAVIDRDDMQLFGCVTMYLVGEYALNERGGHEGTSPMECVNWPGTLRFPVYKASRRKMKWGTTRIDVWFYVGDDNGETWTRWHGVHASANNTLVKCRRLKR